MRIPEETPVSRTVYYRGVGTALELLTAAGQWVHMRWLSGPSANDPDVLDQVRSAEDSMQVAERARETELEHRANYPELYAGARAFMLSNVGSPVAVEINPRTVSLYLSTENDVWAQTSAKLRVPIDKVDDLIDLLTRGKAALERAGADK